MNALEKSLERSRSVVSTAQATALQMKQEGTLSGQITPMSGVMGGIQDQAKNRQRYGLFRGWLYSAIHVKAEEAAGQPVNVAKLGGANPLPADSRSYYFQKMGPRARCKTAHQELEILEDHPLIDILDRPNPIQHRWQFVYNFFVNLELTGWSYIVSDVGEDGRLELYSLPTTWVTPIHKDRPFGAFKIMNPRKSGQEGQILDRNQVAFAHIPNPSDPLAALAPAASQMMSIRIDDHIQTSQERFFQNGIFPSVVITMGKNPVGSNAAGFRPILTGPQRRQVVGAINRTMTGVANYGNPAIIDGMIESIDRLSAVQNEMGWEKSEGAIRTRLLSAVGVHPFILGEPVKVGGYAQAATIEERFCKRINTYLDMLGTVISTFAAPMADVADGDKLLVWWDKCEPHDPSLHSQNMREARKNNDITRNEMRASLGFPPAEEQEANKSKLLETVGGLQAALVGLEKAGQGIISREELARIFAKFFDLPEDEAQRIVGVGEESVPEAVEEIRRVIGELQKPVKIDLPAIGVEKMVAEAIQAASDSTVDVQSVRTEVENTEEKILELTNALEIEKTKRQYENKITVEASKMTAQQTINGIEKAVAKLETVMLGKLSDEDRTGMIRDVLEVLSEKTSESFKTIQEAIEKPINVNITNEVNPTPIEVTNEVNPTPIKVTNEVNPTPVSVQNEVKVPSVNVNVEPTPLNIEGPKIKVDGPTVNVEAPEVTIEPKINVKVPPADITVNHEDGPKQATIRHSDGTMSQIELKE